jgi:competence protein ComEC
MNVFNGMPFLRILPAFCFGIIYAFFMGSSSYIIPVFLPVGFLILFLLTFLKSMLYKLRFFRGFIINVVFFSLGFTLTSVKDSRDSEDYFMNSNSVILYKAAVKNATTIKNNKFRILTEIVAIYSGTFWKASTGGSYIYMPTDSAALSLHTGDEIIFSGKPDSISKPLNPGQFDFKRYASIQRIYTQFFIQASDWKMLSKENNYSLKRIAEDIRNRFLQIYQRAGLSGQEYAVLSALVLGYDDEIDQKTVQAFSATGTLHVLSVSGMHVGIIFSALSGILFFMERNRTLRSIRLVILIASLWFYALLTGFSPSVIRSAMMFSFILIGRSLNRSSSIYNSLALSAFSIFILFDPLLLFNTGLQLSFTAVWGIAFLYNGIYKTFIFENWLTDKIWSLIAVSIAAQAATFAISIYYFHQFPNYFILANLIIIPISTICIFSGIALLFLNPFNYISVFAGKIIQTLIHWLNESALFIERLPYAVWNGISISFFDLILMYLFLIVLVIWIEKKSIILFYGVMTLINIIVLSSIVTCYSRIHRNGLFLFSGTSGFCGQRVLGFDSWLITAPDDSAKAINYSDSYCNFYGIPKERRRMVIFNDSIKFYKDGKIGVVKNRLVLGNYVIHILSDSDKETYKNDTLKSDLLYINKALSRKSWTKKLITPKIIFTDNRNDPDPVNSFLGKNTYNLFQGAKWIDLQ